MTFDLESCRLRSWRDGDQDALVRHANSRYIARWMLDRFPHPYTRADADEWIASCREAPPGQRFAVEIGGVAAGAVGIEPKQAGARHTGDLGYWLGEGYWGRGIMTEAVRAVTPWAFEAHRLARIQAVVFAGNASSVRVLEKSGYAFEGRLRQSVVKGGALLDQLVYARLGGVAEASGAA